MLVSMMNKATWRIPCPFCSQVFTEDDSDELLMRHRWARHDKRGMPFTPMIRMVVMAEQPDNAVGALEAEQPKTYARRLKSVRDIRAACEHYLHYGIDNDEYHERVALDNLLRVIKANLSLETFM